MMQSRTAPSRIVLGITGATGAIFGIRILERLRACGIESHLVLSRWARATIELETAYTVADVEALADVRYAPSDQAAAISSGSFPTGGMIVAPCSMKTLAGIRAGYANELIERAADVTLKEGRKLVLVVRESPLSAIHLENMLALARIGVSILPPVPGFYAKPQSVDELVDHVVTRALDQLGIDVPHARRWNGTAANRNLPGDPTFPATPLPPELLEFLSETPREEERACELLTVDGAGFPHAALLGRGEIAACGPGALALALWPDSRVTVRLRASGQATLSTIVGDGHLLARLRLRSVPCAALPDRACFIAEILSCEVKRAPYAQLRSGIAFVPTDRGAFEERVAAQRQALATLAAPPT